MPSRPTLLVPATRTSSTGASKPRPSGCTPRSWSTACFPGRSAGRPSTGSWCAATCCSQAFTPSWNFSKRYTFPAEALVPWPALQDWIPQRVNAWLERLEKEVTTDTYQALHLVSLDGTLDRPACGRPVRRGRHRRTAFAARKPPGAEGQSARMPSSISKKPCTSAPANRWDHSWKSQTRRSSIAWPGLSAPKN